MTAVIGILNKHAVAIAADSAVTIGAGNNAKIFNRANKLFRLSKKHPIGVMIYNRGDFMGTPWEIIIKEYRHRYGEVTQPTVAHYKSEFINFLKTTPSFYNSAMLKEQVNAMIINSLEQKIKEIGANIIRAASVDPNTINEVFKQQFIESIVSEANLLEADLDIYPELAVFDRTNFDAVGMLGLQQKVQELITRTTGLNLDVADIIPEIIRLAIGLIKTANGDNLYSGLVFVGYGDDEIFPSIAAVKVSFLINGMLRYIDDKKSTSITHANPTAIMAYAQTDVIDTILSGCDPVIYEIFVRNFEKFAGKNLKAIAEKYQATVPNIAAELSAIDLTPLMRSLTEGIAKERLRLYIHPMMNAIINLSKEDLAEMAESLIYLTYLKRRFTFAQESVGGPVDVAIITKGDGFIWIKRKHYFEADLNQHFFKNY